MATAQEILVQLHELGVHIAADGEKLKVNFNESLIPKVQLLLDELRRHKGEVLAELLASQKVSMPDILSLVPLFSSWDQAIFAERVRKHQSEGLTGKDAEHAGAEDVLRNRRIVHAQYVVSYHWETWVFPTGRGDEAWAWIHGHPQHSFSIRNAEAEIDKIGSKGDPEALGQACTIWIHAWMEAIQNWRVIG
jgi:hypothetical protein